MFKKLLNVGKGHSHEKLQQQQQKNLFQLNEIKSYGFSHLCCLGYSPSLSLLAVGSKYGLLRVLGNSSVEFSHQLESGNAIRQIEFIDCRNSNPAQIRQQQSKRQTPPVTNDSASAQQQQDPSTKTEFTTSAKIVVLTDNGQLILFELKTFRQQNYADNTTQTDGAQCCQQTNQQQHPSDDQQQQITPEYTKLERTAVLDHFRYKPDDDDRSKRVTTIEVSVENAESIVFVGTEGGNLYKIELSKFAPIDTPQQQQVQKADEQDGTGKTSPAADESKKVDSKEADETTAVNFNDEPQIEEVETEPFETIKFDEDVASQLGADIKSKKQGAIESIKRHPASNGKLLLSYHRGLNVIYDVKAKLVDKYFYHNQVLESSCFADQAGDFFYTSHNDGSYIKWDTRQGSQAKANEDNLGQLYGPYPCKPTPKIQACTGLVNDQLEDLIIFSGGMPRATFDDKNPLTIVRAESDGKTDTIKTVLDLTSKVLDFVVITRPRGNLGAGAKSTGGVGGGKKNKHKQQQQQQQQQQRNTPIAVALAILAEEEFVVIDLLNSESYLEFPLPYLNCVHSSAITCNQHYSDVSDELYEQLLAYNKQQLKGKSSANEWPITGGKVIDAPEVRWHDILLTGHEDGSVNYWDVSDLSMRHLLHLNTARFFSTNDDDLVPIDVEPAADDKTDGDQDESAKATQAANNEDNSNNQQDSSSTAWPPLKRVGRFDPYSDDTRLAIRKLSLCPQTGTLVVAGTGGQVLTFELRDEAGELSQLEADEITIVSDQRFTWKGREKLGVRAGKFKQDAGYHVGAYVQLSPPVAATSLDLRSDWHLFALGTSYGFVLYDYANRHSVVNRCTLNVQDFAIVSGDAPGAMSRKKSFRKSLRESFRRLRRGRSQRNQPPVVTGSATIEPNSGLLPKPAFGRVTGVRPIGAPSNGAESGHQHRNVYSAERQVEQKVELGSIVKCITLTSAVITNNTASFKPTLWVGTNSGQVLVYAISLASEQKSGEAEAANQQQQQQQQQQPDAPASEPLTTARLAKEIQLKHKAPIIAIFTTPDAPAPQSTVRDGEQAGDSAKSSPEKPTSGELSEGADAGKAASPAAPEARKEEADEAEQARAGSPAAAQQPREEKWSPVAKKDKDLASQPRVLICSEEQFKVFNLPNLKPFCKFKLTAHEGLRAKKISITQFLKPATSNKQSAPAMSASKSLQSFATQTSPPASPVPPAESGTGSDAANGAKATASESNNNSVSAPNQNSYSAQAKQDSKELMNAKFGAKTTVANNNVVPATGDKDSELAESGLFEPYMVCMSNQGDCAIYSVPDLKRQAQIQVCKREDITGITSTMLTNYGEGYYLKSSSNFLRFSISSQRVLRVLSVV